MRIEKSKTIVSEFHKLSPLFEAYAKALYGKPIGVKIPPKGMPIGAAAFSDGKNIYIVPPTSLGQRVDHQQMLCGINDENGIALCPGCARFEEIFAMVCHEIAHYTGGSFEMDQETHHRNSVEASRKYPRWGSMILNVLEDFRVENQMYESSVGTRVMRRGMVNKVVVPTLTSETPLNVWASFSLLTRGYDQHFPVEYPEKIKELLADPEVNRVINRAIRAQNYMESYSLLDPFMKAVNKHGVFCEIDPEPEPDPIPDEKSGMGTSKSEVSGLDVPPPDKSSGSEPDYEETDASESGSSEGTFESSGGKTIPSDGSSGEDSESSETSKSDSGEKAEDSDSESSSGSESSDSEDSDDSDVRSETKPDGVGSESETPSGSGEEYSDVGETEDKEDDGIPSDVSGDISDTGTEEGSGDSDDISEELSGEIGDESHDYSTSLPPAVSLPETSDPAADTDIPSDATDAAEDDSEPVSGKDDSGSPVGKTEPSDLPTAKPKIVYGTPEDAEKMIKAYSGHAAMEESMPEASEIEVIQELEAVFEDFEDDGGHVVGIADMKFSGSGWDRSGFGYGAKDVTPVSGGVLEKALSKMRVVFAENDKSKRQPNLKSGKVNTRVLGRRASLNDPRIFKKKTQPKKRDYAVVLVMDASGSTGSAGRLALEKSAIKAQADILSALGVKFAIFAHSGDSDESKLSSGRYRSEEGWVFIKGMIKDWNDPWSSKQQNALATFPSLSANLDGHAMLMARHMIMRPKVTDRIVMYYSDGGMPMEDGPAQKRLLTREIKWMQSRGIIVAGVGIFSDAPKHHGLPTVEIRKSDDLPLVVSHLESLMER